MLTFPRFRVDHPVDVTRSSAASASPTSLRLLLLLSIDGIPIPMTFLRVVEAGVRLVLSTCKVDDDDLAERLFCPEAEVEELRRKKGIPLEVRRGA